MEHYSTEGHFFSAQFNKNLKMEKLVPSYINSKGAFCNFWKLISVPRPS